MKPEMDPKSLFSQWQSLTRICWACCNAVSLKGTLVCCWAPPEAVSVDLPSIQTSFFPLPMLRDSLQISFPWGFLSHHCCILIRAVGPVSSTDSLLLVLVFREEQPLSISTLTATRFQTLSTPKGIFLYLPVAHLLSILSRACVHL